MTEEEKARHLSLYEAHEGVKLDEEKMEEKNPGMRSLAKMMLNSFWGKFGQRCNKTQIKEFDDPVAFWTFHESKKVDVRYVNVVDKERVEIHYKNEKEDDPVSPNLNIFVAAFTTCLARLHLYDIVWERESSIWTLTV